MSTLIPASDPAPSASPALDYAEAEGFGGEGPPSRPLRDATEDDSAWRSWVGVGIGLVGLVALIAAIVSVVALATPGSSSTTPIAAHAHAEQPATAAAVPAAAPTLADAEGIDFEPFERVDPTLPAVPPGAVKKFKVDVFQHVTQVSKDLAPTEVWRFAVNGEYHRGTGVSGPLARIVHEARGCRPWMAGRQFVVV